MPFKQFHLKRSQTFPGSKEGFLQRGFYSGISMAELMFALSLSFPKLIVSLLGVVTLFPDHIIRSRSRAVTGNSGLFALIDACDKGERRCFNRKQTLIQQHFHRGNTSHREIHPHHLTWQGFTQSQGSLHG